MWKIYVQQLFTQTHARRHTNTHAYGRQNAKANGLIRLLSLWPASKWSEAQCHSLLFRNTRGKIALKHICDRMKKGFHTHMCACTLCRYSVPANAYESNLFLVVFTYVANGGLSLALTERRRMSTSQRDCYVSNSHQMNCVLLLLLVPRLPCIALCIHTKFIHFAAQYSNEYVFLH